MSIEWFRHNTWTAQDAAYFQARLKRCRNSGKAQYLRIQAVHLAEVGEHDAALSLLDQLFREHPDPFEFASSYLQKAESLAATGRDEEAIVAFRASLSAQQDRPSAKTNVQMDFAWFILQRRITNLYGEALNLVDSYEADGFNWLPIHRYRCAVVRALVADERNDKPSASKFAALARQAAAQTNSGLRYHPKVGLVAEKLDASIQTRLAEIDH